MIGRQEGMCILKFFRDCVPVAVVVDSLIPTKNYYQENTPDDDSQLRPKFACSLDPQQGYPAMFEKVAREQCNSA